MRSKKIVIFIICAVFLLCGAINVNAFAAEDYRQSKVKVFYPLQRGFSEQDEDGNFSGYTYEYLMRLAQLSGWTYDFNVVEANNESLSDGIEKVKSGELDLTGAMVYNAELAESYAYTSQPYGESHFTLIGLESNTALNARSILETNNLRIAIIPNLAQNEYVEEYFKKASLDFIPVYAESNSECLELVRQGKADAAVGKDVTRISGFKSIVRLGSQPFYFAASKSNAELIKEIDKLISALNLSDPYFQSRLHTKYFSSETERDISLTADESDFIASSGPIKILVPINRAPIQSYDEGSGEFSGIIIDLIKKISEKSGLQFELIPSASYTEIQAMINDKSVDMIAGVPYDFSSIERYYESNILLTSPIFSSPIVRISNINGNGSANEILVAASIKLFDKTVNVKYIHDITELFRLVDTGKYKEAYANGYMAQYYVEKAYLKNVSISPTNFSNYQLCLGAVRGKDLRLMSIIEQAVAALTEEEIEEIVYFNTSKSGQSSLLDMFKRNPMPFIIPLTVLLVIIVTLLIMLVITARKANKMISEEKNRYKSISQTDLLSRAYNNASFKRLCEDYLNSIPDSDPVEGAFIICDIDNFKAVNDTYGHLIGDKAVERLGGMLLSVFRDDIVGRLGGDEFGIFIKSTKSSEEIAESCREMLKQAQKLISECNMSLSIGAAIFTEKISFDELLKRADNVMYDVKSEGKNNYRIYVYNGTDINSRV